MGGGGELDLLELRLHELDGVVDRYVVTESPHGNRCDKKPMHFWKERHRFSDFLDRIEYITTEPCKKYMEDSRRCHAMEVKKRPKELYFQQNNQRDCAWDEMKKKLDGIPEDALVVLTDLDEIPWGKTLNLLKHCEVKKSVRFPLRMQQQVIPFSLRNGCPESRKRYNKGNIALWKQLFDGKLNGPQAIWPQKGTDALELAGVHLTNYGTRGQVDYRLLNHGASGQLLPLMLQGGKRISLCDVSSMEQVQSMQQQYLDSPISVVRNWEKEKNGKLKHDPKTKLPNVKTADLAKCEIPWPLLARPERPYEI